MIINEHKIEETVSSKEVSSLIDWLSQYGYDSEGGITRLLYTNDWLEAQEGLKQLINRKGFHTYYDEVGNLFGRLGGSTFKDETILTGSHIDTVVNGGKFDGQLGIIGGILAIEYLNKKFGKPLRNIEVVSMAEEEGSRFPYTFWGSRNIVGTVKKEVVEDLIDMDGIRFIDAMRNVGFDFKDEDNTGRNDIKAFIELHVEQGGVLEIEQKSIGIVEHIVGQKRFTIEVTGQSNHAGTTPMGYRRDALYCVSKMISEIMDLTISYGDPLVATVGSIEVIPNTSNVVPGKVVFSLDIRHIDEGIMTKYTDEVISRLQSIASKMELNIKVNNYMDCLPIVMDSNLVNKIIDSCERKGLNYKLMHSGAGHDSQIFAKTIPTAMIFVPSHDGISHSPMEFTETKDLIEGIKALIETLYCLAYK
jgi:allantoate deiminase